MASSNLIAKGKNSLNGIVCFGSCARYLFNEIPKYSNTMAALPDL